LGARPRQWRPWTLQRDLVFACVRGVVNMRRVMRAHAKAYKRVFFYYIFSFSWKIKEIFPNSMYFDIIHIMWPETEMSVSGNGNGCGILGLTFSSLSDPVELPLA
jgi:hypothetical protein